MKIEELRRADCNGCEACANICPKNAIAMTRDAEGFAYPKINSELCIKCGRCDAICPALNFKEKIPAALPKVFAVINPDEKIRRHSSSGGVFTALSEKILHDGGIVFGAAFDKNFNVVHSAANNLDELENLRGSKYVQSRIGNVYRQVKDALNSRKVLFSGTPCQCVGLKHFLGADHENLLTVDVICHGAPSPAIWEIYIGELGHSHDIAHVNFRSKRNGWAISNVEINFSDKGYYFCSLSQNLYGKIFLSSLSERPSCSSCKAKFPNCASDLTLGDAWGVQNFALEMFDNRGTSIVFIHTDKGKKFFEQLTLNKKQIAFDIATRSNIAFMTSLVADTRRENFFADIARSADKFAVIEKYFYQDDAVIRKKNGEQNRQLYQSILAQIIQQTKKNILVVTADEHDRKKLEEFFAASHEDCGLHVIQPKDIATLPDLIKQNNIAEIFIKKPIELSPAMIHGIGVCNLPVKIFSIR